MSTLSCAFVVRDTDAAQAPVIDARVRALARFYAPIGLGDVSVVRIPRANAWAGRLGPGGPLEDRWDWGAPFGAHPAAARASAFGSEDRLRDELVGFGAAAAWSEEAVRIVTAPSGPVGLYRARGPALEAWATHAVAAAYLAFGTVTIDADALPELVAFDFVGSTRTLIRDVVPVPPATRIDVSARGAGETSYWPSPERWARVPEPDAYEHTASALVDSLERRTGDGSVSLALTAGADSRVLAIALHDLGKPVSAFCWGHDGWPDVEGARGVAAALGMPFRCGATWRAGTALPGIADAEARWSDGRLVLSLSEREWPGDADAVVLGAAGEVGRAFYYRRRAGRKSAAGPDELRDSLNAAARLPQARPEAIAQADASTTAWIDQAKRSGLTGWRILDVVYAEQRVGCWGRIQMPALPLDIVAGFAPQQVIRGLASLPLGDRLGDGFHRRFVAERRPALALPAPDAPAKPGGLRLRAGHLRRRLAGARRPATAADPLLVTLWGERPDARDWVADAVLRSELVAGTLGEAWAEATRSGFLAGHRRAAERAAVACAPVVLASALADLEDASPTAQAPVSSR